MAGHTPGPWSVVSDFVGPYRVVTESGSTVAMAGYTNSTEAMANAELMAAAPDLLAALRELLSQAEDDVDDRRLSPEVMQAHAAIAKAEGQP